MRYALVLTAAAFFAPIALSADPPAPPITFQTQPANRVLGDLRAAADLIGGAKAVKALNDSIKERFGEKGFNGLDMIRPVVGYVNLAPKPEDITAVIAFPITNEKDFLALCERFNKGKPEDLGKGLYQLPPLDPQYKARMRFSEQYAYISYGSKPEPALEAKALVPANKLYDPADQALFAGKLHFDRLTPEVKLAAAKGLEDFKKALDFGNGRGGFGIGAQEAAVFKPLVEEFEKMVGRYFLLLGGGDTATLRLNLDVPTGDLSIDAALKGKPDSALSKAIAGFKPVGNKFAGLLGPDTAVGFKTRLPFFNDELKTGAAKSLEEGQKLVPANDPSKALADEIFKGLIRTVKTGEVDIVGAVRGPNKDGDFSVVAAGAFEGTTALEKEFKAFVEKNAPENEQERFKWSADKAGAINIHTYKMAGGNFFDVTKPFGGDKCVIAFAFAPKGVFVAVGTDAVTVVKDALTVKAADAPVIDIVVNPDRLVKLIEKAGGPAAQVERVLGKEDKLVSAMSLAVSGGKELKVRYAINLRILPPALFTSLEEGEGAADPLEKK
ncbi:hypothetical protein VT84_38955 [Gemmata sp. SH-PL17]|uniref:hypothetical protein n=1 Tax=Gemmata sp. SH-PL17 TaxID=1630693 RepID=UPI00078B8F9F|nr:hypothetical protein [Gemmata sp. SH-PL17]AMV30438.1 hypothetical protein VT84_38955 [Gemmata sp. SH-PL17]